MKKGTRAASCLAAMAMVGGLAGCSTSLSVSEDKKPPQIKSAGLIDSYVACNGFRPYDGTFFEAEILDEDSRWGGLASLDVWPIGGVGISVIGARIKILPFEAGLGILGYNPEPESYWKNKKPENPANEETEVVPQED
jgi:hypothetical protein